MDAREQGWAGTGVAVALVGAGVTVHFNDEGSIGVALALYAGAAIALLVGIWPFIPILEDLGSIAKVATSALVRVAGATKHFFVKRPVLLVLGFVCGVFAVRVVDAGPKLMWLKAWSSVSQDPTTLERIENDLGQRASAKRQEFTQLSDMAEEYRIRFLQAKINEAITNDLPADEWRDELHEVLRRYYRRRGIAIPDSIREARRDSSVTSGAFEMCRLNLVSVANGEPSFSLSGDARAFLRIHLAQVTFREVCVELEDPRPGVVVTDNEPDTLTVGEIVLHIPAGARVVGPPEVKTLTIGDINIRGDVAFLAFAFREFSGLYLPTGELWLKKLQLSQNGELLETRLSPIEGEEMLVGFLIVNPLRPYMRSLAEPDWVPRIIGRGVFSRVALSQVVGRARLSGVATLGCLRDRKQIPLAMLRRVASVMGPADFLDEHVAVVAIAGTSAGAPEFLVC